VAHALVSTGFGRRQAGLRILLGAVGVLSLVAAGAVFWLLDAGPYAIRDYALLAAVWAATGAVTLGLVLVDRGAHAVTALAAGFILFNYLFVLRALPDAERLKPVPAIAAVLSDQAAPDAVLASWSVSVPSLVYYVDRPVLEVGSLDHAGDLLTGDDDVWLVTRPFEWDALNRRALTACVVMRLSDFAFNARLPEIVNGTPPAGLVVVRNRCDE
jgi:hypothetical protein